MFPQRQRLLILAAYVAALFVVNYAAVGQFPVLSGGKSLWFYTALANILLGNLLITPYYVKPADVTAYSVAGIVALGSVQDWIHWGFRDQLAFTIGFSFCLLTLLLSIATILTKDAAAEIWVQWHQTFRLLSNKLGSHRVLFSVVIFTAIFIFHRHSTREVAVILLGWVVIASRSENIVSNILSGLRLIWRSGPPVQVCGSIVAYQAPRMVLIRQEGTRTIPF